jgi:hypothetical protein
MPRLAAWVAVTHHHTRAQAVLTQPSRSRFQTCWFLHLLFHRRPHATVPESFFYPARRFLHAQNLHGLHSLHRRNTCPVSGHRPGVWTSDLFSSQPRPEFVGSPVESCLQPLETVKPVWHTLVIVYSTYLYINHLLSVNKLVLSYLFLRLVPQICI